MSSRRSTILRSAVKSISKESEWNTTFNSVQVKRSKRASEIVIALYAL